MTGFADDDVTAAQDPCRAGHEPHHMVSHGVPNGWILRCSICGMFDLTEYDAGVAARAVERFRPLLDALDKEFGPPEDDDQIDAERIILNRWLRRAEGHR